MPVVALCTDSRRRSVRTREIRRHDTVRITDTPPVIANAKGELDG
jgi:hypothetical protein